MEDMSVENSSDIIKKMNEKVVRQKMRKAIIGICAAFVLIGGVVIGAIIAVNNIAKEQEIATDSGDTEKTNVESGEVVTTISGKSVSYKGAYVVDGEELVITSGEYISDKDDEVVFLVINGGKLTIDGDVTITKSGSEDFDGRGDSYSFYGTNSAIAVVGEDSVATINGATITTNVNGANAIVATKGGTVDISDSLIHTSLDSSRGLHATYSGVITADKVTIETYGGSSAALATDRGAGTVTASNMTLSTSGAGSPLIYSTGAITVANSSGTAAGAQIAVLEGKNSINIDSCNFYTNGIGNRNGVDNAGVMIYQSMSGDAAVGVGNFTASNSNLSVLSTSSIYTSVPFFFVTNTEATINLDNVDIQFYDGEAFILATGTDEWGDNTSNGANLTVVVNNLKSTNTRVDKDELSSVEGM